MSGKSLKSQLTSTIKDADSDLKKRIQQAEDVLSTKTSSNKKHSTNKITTKVEPALTEINPIKVIKENYTMPESDYQLLETLRIKFASTGNILSKSETIRAGLLALAKLDNNELANIASALIKLKPGRVPLRTKED